MAGVGARGEVADRRPVTRRQLLQEEELGVGNAGALLNGPRGLAQTSDESAQALQHGGFDGLAGPVAVESRHGHGHSARILAADAAHPGHARPQKQPVVTRA